MENEEKMDLKEAQKERILEIKDVDLAVFEAYLSYPQEFQEKLPFASFYVLHREKLESEFQEQQMHASFDEEDADEEPIERPTIPEDEQCTKCNKRRMDMLGTYCIQCRSEMRTKANDRGFELREEIIQNPEFQKATSEKGAVAWVKQNYNEERKKNPLIPLSEIAKEAYGYMKMRKI